jgi:hypothetical protein
MIDSLLSKISKQENSMYKVICSHNSSALGDATFELFTEKAANDIFDQYAKYVTETGGLKSITIFNPQNQILRERTW